MVRVRHDLDNSMPIFTSLWELYWPLESTLTEWETENMEALLHQLDLHWNEGKAEEAIALHADIEHQITLLSRRTTS